MYADEDKDSAGLLLDSGARTPKPLYLRRNPASGYNSRFGHHVFCLKTDDASDTDHIATLKVLGSDGTVTSMKVFGDDFPANNTYQDFHVEYDIGPKTDSRGSIPVRYQVEWTDRGNLWVDNIRAHDFEIDPRTRIPVRPPNAARLFRGDEDEDLEDALKSHHNGPNPPWRFALYDEPRWEVNESVAYVDRFIKAQTGGTPGISPYNVPESLEAMERYVDTVSPPELLVDFYPISNDRDLRPDDDDYAKTLQGRLDWLVTGYGQQGPP